MLRFILLLCLAFPAHASYGLFNYTQERYDYSKNVQKMVGHELHLGIIRLIFVVVHTKSKAPDPI